MTAISTEADANRPKATLVEEPMLLPEAARLDDEGRLLPPILLQYWHIILRWRYVLLGIIAGTFLLGVLATMLMAPRYTATSEIEISRQQKRVTNLAGVQEQEQPQDLEFYATQYALLRANSLADRVSKKLKLSTNQDFFASHGSRMPEDAAKRDRLAVKLLLDHIAIQPVRSSRLVDISYTGRSAELAAQITNTWVKEFIGATTDREYDSTAQARTFLESRLDALRSKMEISEQNAVRFAAANNIVALETSRDADGKTRAERTLTSADLEQLNTAMLVARADRISAEARARTGRADVSSDVLANQAIGLIKQKRAEVAGEYAKLLTQYEPGYPAAKALKNELDALDASLAHDTARFGAERVQSYQQALARERDLAAQVKAAKTSLERQNQATIQYHIFQREADTNRQLYDGLLQRYKEIAEAGAVGASNIAIVDYAKVPNLPSYPKVLINLAVALLAGIGLAAFAVVILDQMDEGIRSPEDVWRLLNLPLLGNVPLSDLSPRDALNDSKSAITEAYLSIRSNLAFSTSHGMPRSLAFTSTQPAEGKSTSAIALAQIIGRTGKSVVLIDADMRSPSVHGLAGVANRSGLSNLLTGDTDVAAHLLPTDQRGLSVIPAGPLPPNPAELLSSDRLSLLVSELLESFDHVVIDAPPVLGLADSPLICRAVEGSVFVAEPGRSSLRAIRASLQRLKLIHARLFGVIITKIDSKQQYGYSYGYGYDYSYGDNAKDKDS